MAEIREHARVLRSKNCGPYEITLDIIFKDWDEYHRAKDAEIVSPEVVADLYDIPEERISAFTYYDPAKAIKVTIKRDRHAASPGDHDFVGMQQYAPLLKLQLPEK